MDTDSQLITAVEVLPGNAPDNLGALELVEASEANTGVPVAEAMGDAAYGDGDTRQAFADAGRTLIARVPGRPNRTHFPKEDWHIDLEAGSCTCPDQLTRTMVPAGRRPAKSGSDLPFRGLPKRGGPGYAPCGPSAKAAKPGTGRTVQLHPQEDAVTAGPRPGEQSEVCRIPACAEMVVEHRLARLDQLGIRQSRTYFGRAKTVPAVPGSHRGQPVTTGGLGSRSVCWHRRRPSKSAVPSCAGTYPTVDSSPAGSAIWA